MTKNKIGKYVFESIRPHGIGSFVKKSEIREQPEIKVAYSKRPMARHRLFGDKPRTIRQEYIKTFLDIGVIEPVTTTHAGMTVQTANIRFTDLGLAALENGIRQIEKDKSLEA